MFSQIFSHTAISSYLAQPRASRPHHRWPCLRISITELRRRHPLLIWRTSLALLVWTAANAGISYLIHRPLLPYATTVASVASAPTAAGSTTATLPATPTPATELTSAAVRPASTTSLSSDATGWILAPIAMAPDYTYANNYDSGQCTWYVASRRRVPNNWGNADNWYYAARADGWSTGQIPAVGAIATTEVGPFGHVALVEGISADYTQVYISEMNYLAIGIKSYRWAAASSFRYIY